MSKKLRKKTLEIAEKFQLNTDSVQIYGRGMPNLIRKTRNDYKKGIIDANLIPKGEIDAK